MVLVFIEGGPFANQAFDSDVLLNHPAFDVSEYRWTSRTIRGTVDPTKVAQVWQHVSIPETTPVAEPGPVQTAAENPHATASSEAVHEAAVAVSSPSPEVASGTSESAAPDADYTGAPVEVGDDGDLPDGEELFLRRRRLKLTVKEVSDGTGLATSKISAIEKGTGKRVKPGEVRTLHDFLASREGGGGPR